MATLPGGSLFISNGSSLRPSGCWFFQFSCTKQTSFSHQPGSSQLRSRAKLRASRPGSHQPWASLSTRCHPQVWLALGPGMRVGSSSQGPFPCVVRALAPTFPAWGSRGPAEPAGGDARDGWGPRAGEVLVPVFPPHLETGRDPSDTAAVSRMCCVSSGVQAGGLP